MNAFACGSSVRGTTADRQIFFCLGRRVGTCSIVQPRSITQEETDLSECV